MKDRFFSTVYIAGFMYHDGIDVYEDLKVGVKLSLKAEPNNQFDPYAVAIFYNDTKLGYIPTEENKLISKFLNCGHTDLFDVKINQVNSDAYPEKQIRVLIRILDKNKEIESWIL